MSELDALLDMLPSRVLVCGKGGVGKTTCAAALAARAAARATGGETTLILSTDPACSLGDALGVALAGSPACVPDRVGLAAMQLDPVAARDEFLSRWRDVLVTIVDRGTYLGRDDIASLVDAALPGLDETMALLTLLDLQEGDWARIVLDTAPTGHTLRLLALPESFLALLALLDTMQEKHRFMVRALTHRYRSDDADRFLELMRGRLCALRSALADPGRFSVVLVTRAEALVAEETARYANALADLGLVPCAIVVNALPAGEPDGSLTAALLALSRIAPDAARYHVPLLDLEPLGVPGIELWGEALSAGCCPPHPCEAPSAECGSPASRETRREAGRVIGGRLPRKREGPRQCESRRPGQKQSWLQLPVSRPLTIVGGKGGVGKTSVACALGIALASPEHPTLVVSTDPAPSVADALAQPVAEEVVPVAGAPGLFAQQLDASAAFTRFRERYRARVDALFDALLRGSLDAAHDRSIARDLLALAPPGMDELYALAVLGDTLAAGRFATVIVDPAPTGHLIRLLELPAPALEWSHRLLRLVLEYKEVVQLGEAAEEMLDFARRTRSLGALLHDAERAGALVVALDEPLVREETARLVNGMDALGVAVLGVLWNRAAARRVEPLPMERSMAQFEAAMVTPAPRGVHALRHWASTWGAV